MMQITRRLMFGLAASALLAATAATPANAAGKIHIAFGDIATVETLNFLIAVERAKERGVDIDVTYFKSEDIAAQAVVGGQADVGVGAPYTVLQKVKAPIRIFFQMSTLRFYPVVNTEFYQDWKDLNGQEIAVHSRGSGTEAIMQLMAKRKGIEYGNISYVPGSEVRATALIQGHVNATIVDSTNWRIVQDKGGGKFKLLEIDNVDATDEALYANTAFLEREQAAVDILVEELVRTWREINANPKVVTELRAKYDLLPDMPEDLVAEIEPYYESSVASATFPASGGGAEAAQRRLRVQRARRQARGRPCDPEGRGFLGAGPTGSGTGQARAGLSGAPARYGGAGPSGRGHDRGPGLAVAGAFGRRGRRGLGDRRAGADQLRLPDLPRHDRRPRRHDRQRRAGACLSLDPAAAGDRGGDLSGGRGRAGRRHGPVAAARMARRAIVHRAAGGTHGGADPADHLCLWHRPDLEGDRRLHPRHAGDRAQLVRCRAQRQPVPDPDVPLVPGHALAAGRQGDHPRRGTGDLRRPAAGVAAGFIGVVLAELLITPTGIGDLITYYRSMADYPQMYATILSIIVFSAVTIELLGQVETRLFRPERRGR